MRRLAFLLLLLPSPLWAEKQFKYEPDRGAVLASLKSERMRGLAVRASLRAMPLFQTFPLGGGGGGAVTIGGAVGGGAANCVLFEDASQNLGCDATNFFWQTTADANYLRIGAGTSPGAIRLLEGSAGGTNYGSLTVPSTLGGDRVYTLPDLTTTIAGLAVTPQTFTGRQILSADVSGSAANSLWCWNSTSTPCSIYDTAQTPDSLVFPMDATSRAFQIVVGGSNGSDYALAQQTNPTLVVRSASVPATSTVQYIAITHNTAHGTISTGLGPVALNPGAAVASAAALPLPTGNVFHVTGTTNITSITATGFTAGMVITLIFDDVLTFTDGNNLVLAGNFVTTANDAITLAFDGTNFYEMARAVN